MQSNKTHGGKTNPVILFGGISLLLVGCCLGSQLFSGEEAAPEESVEASMEPTTAVIQSTETSSPDPTDTSIPQPSDTPQPTPTREPAIPETLIDIPALLGKDAYEVREIVTDRLGEPSVDSKPPAEGDFGTLGWTVEEYEVMFGFDYLADGRILDALILTGFGEYGHTEEDLLRAGNLDRYSPKYSVFVDRYGSAEVIDIWVPVSDQAAQELADVFGVRTAISDIREIVEDELGTSNRDAERVQEVRAVGDGLIYVKWAINDNITPGLVRTGAKHDIVRVAEALCNAGHCSGLRMEGTFSMLDQHGNVSEESVVKVTLEGATLAQINWSSFLLDNLYSVADTVWVHPKFED